MIYCLFPNGTETEEEKKHKHELINQNKPFSVWILCVYCRSIWCMPNGKEPPIEFQPSKQVDFLHQLKSIQLSPIPKQSHSSPKKKKKIPKKLKHYLQAQPTIYQFSNRIIFLIPFQNEIFWLWKSS